MARTDTPFSCEFMVGVETAVDTIKHRISDVWYYGILHDSEAKGVQTSVSLLEHLAEWQMPH